MSASASQTGEVHHGVKRNPQFEQFVTHLGWRKRLPLVEVESPFRDGSFSRLRGIEHIQRSVVPSTARTTAYKRILASAHGSPHNIFEWCGGNRLKRIEQQLIADSARTAQPFPGHRQRYASASRRWR